MKRAFLVLGLLGVLVAGTAFLASTVFGSTATHPRTIVYSDLQQVEAAASTTFDWSGACTGKGCAANIQPGAEVQPGTQVPEVPTAALLLGSLGAVGGGFIVLANRRRNHGA